MVEAITLADALLQVIPAYHCPVCGEDVDGTIMGIYTHLAGHHAELLVKVDKLLESIG